MRRSRRELSNEASVAKYCIDTTEKEASEVWPACPHRNTIGAKKSCENELKDISSHDVPRSYVAIHSCWGLRDYLTTRVAPESVVARAACDPERHKMLGHAARLVAIVRHHVELRKENQCLHVQTSGPQRVEDETYVYLF